MSLAAPLHALADLLERPMAALQRALGQRRFAWVFLVPNLVIFGAFTYLPIGLNFVYATTGGLNVLPHERTFVGLENFATLLACGSYLDPASCTKDLFWRSLFNTAWFVVLQVGFMILFSLATAAVVGAERVSGARIPGAVDLVGALLSAGSMTLGLGYFTVLQARTGQTLGKAALGIRVESTAGRTIGIARSVVRTLGYVASALPLGAGFLLALGPARRTLHDRLAGTVVVRVRSSR